MSAQPVNPSLPPDHVTVFIDGVELAAPKGSMIIQAADKAGIPIPRFCYHDKLAIAANCRMCLVEVEKMPKPAPACATPVMDGMKVSTRCDFNALSLRVRTIIPCVTGVAHAGIGLGAFSMSTRHMRQFAAMLSFL